MKAEKADILSALKADLIKLEGFRSSLLSSNELGLGALIHAFPNSTFPVGAIHEFLSDSNENSAATGGFVAGLLSSLMGDNGVSLWAGTSRTIFPPALKNFGIDADRIIFIDLKKEKDVFWVLDEALKCNSLTAVVGEMRELSFNDSRRLQLAVEQSHVTGFLLRSNFKQINPTACAARWKISMLPSESISNLPGVGVPAWNVELLKVRNGKTGAWNIRWFDGKYLLPEGLHINSIIRKAG